ncbi:MAG TPA: hypothetical protein ENK24_06445 [Anaerolineae bacterium]|nr:hypothetical protein [Anaerolineae bacterium]
MSSVPFVFLAAACGLRACRFAGGGLRQAGNRRRFTGLRVAAGCPQAAYPQAAYPQAAGGSRRAAAGRVRDGRAK